MDLMSNINHSIICAIREGNVEEVRKFIRSYGLPYSKIWLEGYSLLCYSIENKHTEITKLLLMSGCTVNKEDQTPCDTALHLAVRNGSIEIVSMLLDRDIQVNSINEHGRTPLQEAIERGKVDVTELLLKHNANVNVRDNDDLSPLLIAIKTNHSEIVKLVLDHGANVDEQDEDGKTVLYISIRQGNLEIIEHVLKYQPDINMNNNKSCLKDALYRGGRDCSEIVESLLQYGFSVNPEDINDSRLLCSAVGHKCLQIVEFLLQHGADINAANFSGKNAISYAVENADVALTRLLLSNGADITGSPELLHTAVKKECKDIVELLLQHGANINAKNKTKKTAIFYAIENSDLILTKLLITNGAAIKSNPKLLNTAVMKRNREIVELLLQHGANINAKNKTKNTALFYAIHNADLVLTKLLLTNGADVKGSPKLLNTAVRKKCTELVEELLLYGADINAKDSEGKTAIFYAIDNSDFILTKLLLINGANIRGCPELLNTAVRRKSIEIVETLLHYGADVNAKDNANKSAILCAIENPDSILTKMLIISGADIKGSPELLNTAVKKKRIDIVETLLRHGADINAKDNAGKTAIFCAIENADVILTQLFITKGADIKNNPELLHAAVKNKCGEIIEILLQHGADINAKDKAGKTPIFYASEKADLIITKLFLTKGANIEDSSELLHTAVKKKRIAIVEALLEYGANINAKDYKKRSPIFYAIERTDLILTKKLLINGANIKDSPELLNCAVKNRCREIVEILLQHGADINAEDKEKKPPISFAIENSDAILTTLLITNGADIKSYPRLLHTAVKKKCGEIVKILLEHGADINAKDKSKKTPIFYAIENVDLILTKLLINNGAITESSPELLLTAVRRKSRGIIEVLLQRGADVNAKGKNGKTAIFYAIENADIILTKLLLIKGADIKGNPKLLNIAAKKKSRELVETLLKHGADIHAIDENGFTALHSTSSAFHDKDNCGINSALEITKLLLSRGADVNAKKINGETPLHLAVLNRHKEIVEVFLKCGAKVNSASKSGVTPLHYAVLKGFLEIIKILLEFGADVDYRDKCGKTALHIACEEKHTKVVKFLLEYGSDINIVTKHDCTPVGLIISSNQFFFINDFDSDPDGCTVINCLKEHVFKMIIANLHLNKQNLLLLDRTSSSSLKYSYEKEVEIMKSEKIGDSSVSFYDFLTKNITQLAICAGNETIVQVLKSDDCKRKFPHYGSMINNCFKKAMKRKELLEQVNKCFYFLFNMLPRLPCNCTEKILNYLNNEDLQLLLDVFK